VPSKGREGEPSTKHIVIDNFVVQLSASVSSEESLPQALLIGWHIARMRPGRPSPAGALLVPVMHAGRRLGLPPSLAASRAHAAAELGWLPEPLRRLEPGATYPVTVTPALRALAATLDGR